MPKTAKKLNSKSLIESTMKLAQLMSQDPAGIEIEISKAGENLVGIYTDPNYSEKRVPKLTENKIELLKNAVEDISSGVMTLRSSTMGLAYKSKEIQTYVSLHGTQPEGTVIYSINWKNIAAFKNWRHEKTDSVTQNDIHNAIYYLTFEISKHLHD